VFDPHANADEVKHEFGINLTSKTASQYNAIILAVAHNEFGNLDFDKLIENSNAVIFDTKSYLDRALVDARL
jgi:UDP-N-acetyl-D-galactosamine dehydrogenase